MNTSTRSGSFAASFWSMSSARSSAWLALWSSLRAIRAATIRLSGPMCMVRSSSSSSTPGSPSMISRIAACVGADAARPISSSLLSRPSLNATTTSSTPIAMDPIPFHMFDPVSWVSPTPRAAKTRPTTAALSSNRATLTVMSGLVLTWSSTSSWLSLASPRTCE